MIGALESFSQGVPDTTGAGGAAFQSFFDREDGLKVFRAHAKGFYKHVRCGILHQAETTGGWKITRKGPLLDEATRTVNATRFQRELIQSLDTIGQHSKRSLQRSNLECFQEKDGSRLQELLATLIFEAKAADAS